MQYASAPAKPIDAIRYDRPLATAATKPAETFFLQLHALRAFAIICIVAVHAIGSWLFYVGPQARATLPLDTVSRFNEVLFHDSTIYFALLSGLLYSLVLHHRGEAAFVRSKAAHVLAPYVLMTLIFSALIWDPMMGWSPGTAGVPGMQFLHGYIPTFLINLLTGRAIFAYWYIPIILLLFTLTPTLSRLLAGGRGPAWLGLMLALPLVFSRTGVKASPTAMMYFLAPYALGMWLGQDYKGRLARLARWRSTLLLLALASSVLIYLWVEPGFETHHPSFFSGIETAFYLQKTAFVLWMLLSWRRFDTGLPWGFDQIADCSFAIYLVHAPVMQTFMPSALRWVPAGSPWPWHLAVMALLFVLGLLGSLAVVCGVRAVAGARSKWIVGA